MRQFWSKSGVLIPDKPVDEPEGNRSYSQTSQEETGLELQKGWRKNEEGR